MMSRLWRAASFDNLFLITIDLICAIQPCISLSSLGNLWDSSSISFKKLRVAIGNESSFFGGAGRSSGRARSVSPAFSLSKSSTGCQLT